MVKDLKRHPKANAKVMTSPKLDQFVSDFAPKKVDKARDVALSRMQGSLLYAANPLTNLWAELMEQGMADDPEALVPVPEVLDIIQRSLVLIGNTNNLVAETRSEIVLDAIHSSLKKYAKGYFKDAGSDLFGENFKHELVKKVEADSALSKAVRIVSRSSKVYQSLQTQSKGRAPLFQDSQTSRYGGLRSGGVKHGKYNHFFQNWQEITQNRWIMDTVQGYRIPFVQEPPPIWLPQFTLGQEQSQVITQEIESLLKKGAIQDTQ